MAHEFPEGNEYQPEQQEAGKSTQEPVVEYSFSESNAAEIDAESEQVIRELISSLSVVNPVLTAGVKDEQLQQMESMPNDIDRIIYAHQVLSGEQAEPVSEDKAHLLDGVFTKIGQIRNNKALARLSATLYAFVAFAGAIGGGVEAAEHMQAKAHERIESALNDGHLRIGNNINLEGTEQQFLSSWLDKHPTAKVNIERLSVDDSAVDHTAAATYTIKITENGQTISAEGQGLKEPGNSEQWLMDNLGFGKWTPTAERKAQSEVREQSLEDALAHTEN